MLLVLHLIFLCLWSIIFLYHYKKDKKIAGVYLSYYHSLFVTLYCMYLIYDNGIGNFNDENSTHQIILAVKSICYFICHLPVMIFDKNYLIMCHHIAVLFIVYACVYSGKYGNLLVISLLLGEITNPFRNYGIILKYKKDEMHKLCFLVNTIIFFIVRILIGPISVYYAYTQIEDKLYNSIFMGIMVPLLGVSLKWVYGQIIGLPKMLSKKFD